MTLEELNNIMFNYSSILFLDVGFWIIGISSQIQLKLVDQNNRIDASIVGMNSTREKDNLYLSRTGISTSANFY